MCVPYKVLRSTDYSLSLRGPNGAVAISWQWVLVGTSLRLPRRFALRKDAAAAVHYGRQYQDFR